MLLWILACTPEPAPGGTDSCAPWTWEPSAEDEGPAPDTAVESVSGGTEDTAVPEGCDRAPTQLDLVGEQDADAWFCAGDAITLYGPVTFVEGTTLTIEAGVTMLTTNTGDDPGTLIVRGRIEAQGTPEAPIVLAAQDGELEQLEGLKVYGDAPGATNPDGDPAHDSGTVTYFRIDGGGLVDAAFHFVNVGTGTTLSYLGSVSADDDGFEFDGGAVHADHLVSFDCGDDGFQLEDGFVGQVEHLLSTTCHGSGLTVRNRDPDDDYDSDEPRTAATVVNASLISNYSEGIYFDEEGAGELANLLVAEHSNCGTRIDDGSYADGQALIDVHHVLLWDTDEPWCESSDGHTLQPYVSGLVEEDPLLDDWMPGEGSPALDAKRADTSHQPYLGAFSDEDWTAGWIEEP